MARKLEAVGGYFTLPSR